MKYQAIKHYKIPTVLSPVWIKEIRAALDVPGFKITLPKNPAYFGTDVKKETQYQLFTVLVQSKDH